MRGSLACLVLFAACADTPDPGPESRPDDAIHWCHDLDEARARAVADGRPLAVLFTLEASEWCRVLVRDTLPDPAVVARSRAFHWVVLQGDRTPDAASRFNVGVYPSVLVLGPHDENLYRFEGAGKPAEFVRELDQALRCHTRFVQGEDWDVPAPRPPRICDVGTVTTLPAPSLDVPSGVAPLGDVVWVAYRKELYRLAAADGAVQAHFTLPVAINGLCSDGRLLYGLELGWSAGRPIHVIDPTTGQVHRQIVTATNRGNSEPTAYGIAWADGTLYVLAGRGEIHRLASDGAIMSTLKTPLSYVMGLCFDGARFVIGGREGLHFVDPQSGKVVRHVATHYPVRALGWDGQALLLLEQPVTGFGRKHERIQLWPKVALVHRVAL